MKRIFVFLLSFVSLCVNAQQRIYVNEISGNEKWLEIYNDEEENVDLSGYTLQKIDEKGKATNWSIPPGTIIPSKGFLVWAEGTNVEETFTWGISAKKDVAFKLFDNNGAELDYFEVKSDLYSEGDSKTVGRETDGAVLLVIFSNGGTKGYSNSRVGEIVEENDSTSLLFSPKGIAIVSIDFDSAITIEKDVKTKAFMQIQNSDNSHYNLSELYSGYITIEGRGNSTWGMPKKPYNIDLITENDEDNAKGLLGMPSDEEWCLIASYSDKSLLRIPVAYKLGEMIGMDWSPRLRFVELYVNREYQGVYFLCEKIKRAGKRVDIKKLDKTSPEEHISGGYLVEVTPSIRIAEEDSSFSTNMNSFVIKYPKAKNISQEQKDWIARYVQEVENVLFGDDFTDIDNGFRKYIDEDAAIDWYLVNELAKNNDAIMHASVFIYKDRDGKLKFGPVWDFDIAFGNIDYNNNFMEDSLWIYYASWFRRLFEDDIFKEKVRARYESLKPMLDSIGLMIQVNANQLIETAAVERNFERWSILGIGVWPNYSPFPKTYNGEVLRLQDWIKARMSWLNVNFFTTNEQQCERLLNEKIPLRRYSLDEFNSGESTKIQAVHGYRKYIWNDTIETSNNEFAIDKNGKYWVKVIDPNGCESIISDTITFVKGLDTILLSEGTLIPSFHPDTLRYKVRLNDQVSNVDVTGISYFGGFVIGNVSGKRITFWGDSVIIEVLNNDTISVKRYVVIIEQNSYFDASLQSLVVSSGELFPVFHPDSLNYTVRVSNNVERITLSSIAMHYQSVVSDSIIDTVLYVGENIFKIEVVAGSTEDTLVYVVCVIRDSSSDATLKSLIVSSGELFPTFHKDTLKYKVNVHNNVTEISLKGIAANEMAKVFDISDTLLNMGLNKFIILVKAENQYDSLEYEIAVMRNGGAALQELTVNKGELVPKFNSDSTIYHLLLQDETVEVVVEAFAFDTNAKVEIYKDIDKITITVTTEDHAEQRIYTIFYTQEVDQKKAIEVDLKRIIYPNPTKNYVNVDLKNINGEVEIRLYDFLGTLRTSWIFQGGDIHPLSLHHILPGVYYLVVNEQASKLIVLQ